MLAFSDVVLPEGDGGVERTIHEIYGRLAAKGAADIEILALSKAPRASLPPAFRDPAPVRRVACLPLERLLGLQSTVSWAALPAGFRAAARLRPHVIHAHNLFFFTSLAAAAIATFQRTPLVLTMHVGSVDALPWKHRLPVKAYEQTIGRLLLWRARLVICVSGDVRSHARNLGAPSRKLVVIPNGTDLARFTVVRPTVSISTVTCVGRLIANKGQDDLMRAFALLKAQGIEARLRLVGAGPMGSRLRRLACELGIEPEVEFLGTRDDVERLLGESSLFVRPSLTDGMSLALIEAMAVGLPIVATHVSGAAELIDNRREGLLVPPRDPHLLAAAIAELLTDRSLAAALGCAARAKAQRYGWDTVAARTLEAFSRAAAV